MTRIMRDSVTPGDIPLTGAQLFAGYANGAQSQWPANGWGRFPSGSTVRIDVAGTDTSCDVLDVEKGDATVATAAKWSSDKRKAQPGAFVPIIFCDRETLTPLFNALNAAGLQVVRDFKLWISTLDGTKTVADMTGVVAVQYKAATASSGAGHYDESIVYDDAWKAAVGAPVHGVVVQLPAGQTRAVVSVDGGSSWS